MIFRNFDEEERAELISESFVASMYLSAMDFDVDVLHGQDYSFKSDDMDIYICKKVEQRLVYFWPTGWSTSSTTFTTSSTAMFETYMHYVIEYKYKHPNKMQNMVCRKDLYSRQDVDILYLEILREIHKGIEIIKQCIGITSYDFVITDHNVYGYFMSMDVERTPEYNTPYSNFNLFIDEFDNRFVAEFKGDEHVEVDRCYASDRVQFKAREPTRIEKQICTIQGQLKNRSPCYTLI
ncbi:MAG TPA: hypothetical protein VK190_02725 [Pseudoneobacillus sp.]|nr:hypothetical protein [Pseudoneobacillus sp.]